MLNHSDRTMVFLSQVKPKPPKVLKFRPKMLTNWWSLLTAAMSKPSDQKLDNSLKLLESGSRVVLTATFGGIVSQR